MRVDELLQSTEFYEGQVVELQGVVASNVLEIWVAPSIAERRDVRRSVVLRHPELFSKISCISLLVGGDVAFLLECSVTGTVRRDAAFSSGVAVGDLVKMTVINQDQIREVDLTGEPPQMVIMG